MSSYNDKLRDPRWQKKRLEVMGRDEFHCQHCQDAKSTLNVHHMYYVGGRDPWEYPLWSLVTLCEKCHHEDPEKRIGVVFEGIERMVQLLADRADPRPGVYWQMFSMAEEVFMALEFAAPRGERLHWNAFRGAMTVAMRVLQTHFQYPEEDDIRPGVSAIEAAAIAGLEAGFPDVPNWLEMVIGDMPKPSGGK